MSIFFSIAVGLFAIWAVEPDRLPTFGQQLDAGASVYLLATAAVVGLVLEAARRVLVDSVLRNIGAIRTAPRNLYDHLRPGNVELFTRLVDGSYKWGTAYEAMAIAAVGGILWHLAGVGLSAHDAHLAWLAVVMALAAVVQGRVSAAALDGFCRMDARASGESG